MATTTQRATKADYQILGLQPGASAEELRATYKLLVKRWHPDQFAENTAEKHRAEEKLKIINAAYYRLRHDPAEFSDIVDAAPMHSPNPQHQRPSSSQPTQHHDKGTPLRDVVRARFSQSMLHIFRAFGPVSLFRNSWIPTLLALVSLVLLALYWLDFARPPYREGQPAKPAEVTSAATPPRIITNQTNAAASRPPALPADLLPSSQPLEGRTVTPPREGPRRPPSGQAADRPYFTLGSFKNEVLRIQGKPQRINGQTWAYGLSEVSFKDGRVWGYNNFDGSLNVKLTPSVPVPTDQLGGAFSLGASKDEVLSVQGTPTRLDGNKWYYGLSELTFKDDKVVAYNNFFNALKVVVSPQTKVDAFLRSKTFTIGSSQDEVLAAQGTPTSIQANLWSYELSDVWFNDGKVRAVNDFSNLLKFQPAD